MHVVYESILSGAVGGVNVFIYLSFCKLLDKFMSENVSNMVGLVLDFVLNYLFQQLVFFGKIEYNPKMFYRFLIGNSISLIFSQLIFVYGKKIYNKVIAKYPKLCNSSYKTTLWRYLSNVLIYIFITFPLRKLYIFKEAVML